MRKVGEDVVEDGGEGMGNGCMPDGGHGRADCTDVHSLALHT